MNYSIKTILARIVIIGSVVSMVEIPVEGAYKRTVSRNNAVRLKAAKASRFSRRNARRVPARQASSRSRMVSRQQHKKQPRRVVAVRGRRPIRGRASHARTAAPRQPAAVATPAPQPTPASSAAQTIQATAAEWKQLIGAIEAGDLATVQSLVPSKIPATGKTLTGRSIFAIAQHHGKQPVIAYLAGLLGIAVPRAAAAASPAEIRFYNRGEPYYEFTNFYESPITLDGKVWPTTEHYFQAQKFPGNAPVQEQIRTARTAREVFALANSGNGTYKHLIRPDWNSVSMDTMRKALHAKFTQHANLKQLLLGTGTSELVEASDKDAFWGDPSRSAVGGPVGRNELGKLLMELRTTL